MSFRVEKVADRAGLSAVRALRFDVFCKEKGLDYRALGASDAEAAMGDELDARSSIYLALDGELPVGSARSTYAKDGVIEDEHALEMDLWTSVVPRDRISQSSRFVIRPDQRGGRVSAMIMGRMYTDLRAMGMEIDFLDCQPNLVPFYESVGYLRFRKPYHHGGLDRDYVPMALFLEDMQYQQSIGGRLQAFADRFPNSDRIHKLFEWMFDPEYVMPIHHVVRQLDSSFRFFFTNRRLAQVAEGFERRIYSPEKRIVRQGEASDRFYVVTRGRARVVQQKDHQLRQMAELGPGDFFGEVGLMTGAPRTADVVAIEEVECLALDRDKLMAQLRTHPALAISMLRVLARWYAGQQMAPSASGTVPTPLGDPTSTVLLDPIEEALPRFSRETILHLAPLFPKRTFEEGEVLLQAGTEEEVAYLVSRGQVDVERPDGGYITSADPGDCVGELAVFANLPRTATARAGTGGCEVLVMTRPALLAHLQVEPRLGITLIRRLARLLYDRVATRR